MALLRFTLVIALVLTFPIFRVSARTVEFPIGSGRMVEIDNYGNILEDHNFVWKLFTIGNGIPFWSIQIAQAEEKTLKETIVEYIQLKSNLVGIDAKIATKIAICESKLNPKAFNPKDTDGYPKYSLFQFHKPTFYGAGGKDIWNWQEQTDIAVQMMADGYWKRWPTCYKKSK